MHLCHMRAWAEGLKPAWPKVWLKFWTASSRNLRRSSRQSKLGDLAMRPLSAKLSLLVLLLIAMLISAVVAGNSVAAKHLGRHFHERLAVMFFVFICRTFQEELSSSWRRPARSFRRRTLRRWTRTQHAVRPRGVPRKRRSEEIWSAFQRRCSKETGVS